MAEESSSAEDTDNVDNVGTSIDLFGHKYSFVWTDSGPTLQYSTDGIVTMTRRKESMIPFVAEEIEAVAADEKEAEGNQASEREYEALVRSA